ncbi:hypothetical protein [Helicobacter sp. T3_23-1056]
MIKSNKIDCHESRLFHKSLDSRNDGNHCHTEGVARSISKQQ